VAFKLRRWSTPKQGRFPELLPELAPPPPPPPKEKVQDLLTAKSGKAIAARMSLAALMAAFYLQYYFYGVMEEILTLPAIVVNVPARPGPERISARFAPSPLAAARALPAA
jgi:hypothetical protein